MPTPHSPSRLLIVLPSWVGDAVMATPALRLVRTALPGALICALARPGIDEVLAGIDSIDELRVDHPKGMMGPKKVAARLRLQRFDAALLLTNSFSTALTTRLAGIPRRFGYSRDARTMLLTDHLPAPKRRDVLHYSNSTTDPSAFAPIPAVEYYQNIARFMCREFEADPPQIEPRMELMVTDDERTAGDAILTRAGVSESDQLAILNPGGNNPAKRWPADRFACLADHLCEQHAMTILVSGSPNEADLVEDIIARCASTTRAVALPPLGVRLSSLKRIVQRCRIMVTNDTGPRHIAAALGTPVVTLFGPTDHRWTTIPFDHETILTADPSLPEEEVANDHPDRCAITNITLDTVIEATNARLDRTGFSHPLPSGERASPDLSGRG